MKPEHTALQEKLYFERTKGMIIHDYDTQTEPMISMKTVYGEQQHLVDKCLIIYSKVIHDYLLNNYDCSLIGEISVCNGNIGIYSFMLHGEKTAFYLSGITSTFAAETVCDVNWLTGASKFIMFGSCGSLDREKTFGKYIIPTESYRGEACSYYYAEPADYIQIRNADKLSAIFDEIGAPYVKGRVWTTGSMLRETAGLVRKRKNEGCLAVEMELAGVEAVCSFNHFELYDFLESGDVLGESGWDIEALPAANHNLGKLMIAFEIVKRI